MSLAVSMASQRSLSCLTHFFFVVVVLAKKTREGIPKRIVDIISWRAVIE